MLKPAFELFAEDPNVCIGVPDQTKINVIPSLSCPNISDKTEVSLLGRVFNVDADKQRVIVVLTRDAEDPLLQKFIIPCVGLDMPIYNLVLSGADASVELIEKR